MLTPIDIQNKEFPKAVRGYKEEEVDGFLDLLTLDLEKLIEENRKQQSKYADRKCLVTYGFIPSIQRAIGEWQSAHLANGRFPVAAE